MKNSLYPIFAERWLRPGGTIYIYSDPHFSDEEMKHIRPLYIGDEEQIRRIKSKIGKCDTLIILGDIGDPTPLKQVKGYKVLICGNHDRGASYYTDYFDEVYTGPLFISDRILLSHEPINLPFAYNIHGHDHSNWEVYANGFNMCAEQIGYYPIALKNLIKNGLMSHIPSIHRMTIDRAINRKEEHNEKFNNEDLYIG